eukprot:CAMPEP_0173388310 /NCGR_PEP_ID=MMETSP1356-20130122/10655_1 /TAXON_ID=77927 ORGANISM="Hemiselmis virescens, Strain PCC157" /NCGR_SAMPLE_ID=MMETSP1356 /ASSEMBLY_ACC=CAM_ASM_000847 /LENGTH=54 /DNA_ID=CAMNT_0014345189 /DNA_START=662 /DNA_END=822 /DNA_ORIENTATION=-
MTRTPTAGLPETWSSTCEVIGGRLCWPAASPPTTWRAIVETRSIFTGDLVEHVR